WGRLDVVRTCRAIARGPIREGSRVVLEMQGGELTARTGSGPSRGRALGAAVNGGLVDVGELEGILPVARGRIHLATFRDAETRSPATVRRLRRRLAVAPDQLIAGFGLEAVHLLRRATPRAPLRYGIAAAATEAAQVGVSSLIVVRDSELPRLLAQF